MSRLLSLISVFFVFLVGCSAKAPSSDSSVDVARASASYLAFMKGEFARKDRDSSSAAKSYESVIREVGLNSEILVKRLAQSYLDSDRILDAIAILNDGLVKFPDSEDLLRLRGSSLSAVGDTEGAIADYKRLINVLEEVDEDQYIILSGLYLQKGDVKAAEEVLRDLIESKNDSFHGHFYLAQLALREKNFDTAEKHYKRSLELKPTADLARSAYINFLIRRQRIVDAREICDGYLKEKFVGKKLKKACQFVK